MQNSSITIVHKTKATQLKRMMQQACKINSSHVQGNIKSNKQLMKNNINKQNQICKEKQSQRSNKSSVLVNQLKQLNLKKGLNSSQTSQNNSFKGKQNMVFSSVINKSKQSNQSSKTSKLTSSVVLKDNQLKNLNLQKSLKNLKLNSSTDSIKLFKKNSSTIIQPQKKLKKIVDPFISKKVTPRSKIQSQYKTFKKKQLSLQDFKLGRKLGKGRFGNVYMAEYIHAKFILAIKIVNKKQLKQSDMQNQLIQQIKIQCFMNHPNLLKMYGFFSDQANIYLLLELGTNCLFQQLRIKRKYTQEQTAYYIKQIIQSLKYLHSQNIIHRDIKPQNILLNSGVAKLSDFGWSIYSPIHKRQTFCGTLDYVSPQIVEGYYYDEKVDIWSLGVLCYQLVTGKAPFETQNDQKRTYDKILSVQINFPESMSEELKDLISRILIKQPKQRLLLSQIQNHSWLVKHSKVGRFISKQIWQKWQKLK